MSLFPAIGVAGSGVDAMQAWIDTSAGNVANMDDTAPVGSAVYAVQTPVFQPVAGATVDGVAAEGVEAQVTLGTSKGVTTFEPTNPLADAQGNVAVPNVTLAEQMVGMMSAEEGYKADVDVMTKAETAYTAAFTIGS